MLRDGSRDDKDKGGGAHPGRAAGYESPRTSVSFVEFLLLFFSFQFYDFRLQLLQLASLMCRSRHKKALRRRFKKRC